MLKRKQQLTGFIFGIFLFIGAILPVTTFAQYYEDSSFITGFKIDNINNIPEISEISFQLASELGVDYIQVPITYKYTNELGQLICRHDFVNDTWDWISGLNYYSIFSLADSFDINILPEFYKLGGLDDINEAEYGNFVKSFLFEFYSSGKIKYIEFQNEPVKEFDGFVSLRFKGTPTDLRLSNNAAYDSVKTTFPDIVVGTAGFLATSLTSENTVMNNYYNEYFGTGSDTLKFDVLTLHHYPRNGAYFQTCDETINPGEYDFLSEYTVYQSYRNFLDDLGFVNKPILITEGCFDLPFSHSPPNFNWQTDEITSLLLIERYLLAFHHSQDLNIIGCFISGDEGDNKTDLFKYNHSNGSITKTNRFYSFKYLLEMIEKYPVYDTIEHGYIDSTEYIVDCLTDSSGKHLRIAFCPPIITTGFYNTWYPYVSDTLIVSPQKINITIPGNVDSIKITTVINNTVQTQILENPLNLQYTLGRYPIFIEDIINATSIEEEIIDNTPVCARLNQNSPNPFNLSTTISYQLPVNADISLRIYNLLGQEIRTLVNENIQAGYHSVIWNGTDGNNKPVPSGIYFYQLKTGNDFSETKRMMLLK